MTLLNIGMLWGLVALSIPIIIHFFNLQRPKQVLFSNVAFVKEVKKSVVRRLRFRQWLLLLTRLLAISCLVLAFANPVITGPGMAQLQGNRSVAIVVDDSYSMTAGNEKGNYFQQAQSLARSIVNAYGQDDELLITTTSDLQLNASFGDQNDAIETVKNLRINQSMHTHGELLNFRKEIFANASNGTQELYFLSDFQRATVLADSQFVQLSDSNILIKYMPLATRAQNNVYVASQKILSQIIEKDKPVQMSMSLVNDGNKGVKELGVQVLLEGKVVAINNKSLGPNSIEDLELSFTPTKSGWLSGHIQLDDYPIEFDNKRYFSLYVPEAEKVLVVEGQRSASMRILYEDLFQQFDATFVQARNIASEPLSEYRSLVLLGIQDISSGLADQLRSFVEEGGSLMFFPGEDMNLTSVNAFLGGLGVGQYEPLVTVQDGVKADKIELEHPIFDGVFTADRRQREFDAPNIFKYYPFRLNNSLVQNLIIGTQSQEVCLLESKVGEGLLYTFTIFPGNAWTDFHVKTSFAPVIFRATQIMNQTQNVQSGQEIGAYVPKSIRTSSQELIQMKNEKGLELNPLQYVQSGVTILNFEQLAIAEGNYDLVQGDSLLEKMAFNISDQESQLDFANMDRLEDYLEKAGYDRIQLLKPEAEEITNLIQQEKEGIPLWKYFVLLALLFLVIEILLLKVRRKS